MAFKRPKDIQAWVAQLKRAQARKTARAAKGEAIFGKKRRRARSKSTVRQIVVKSTDRIFSLAVRLRDKKRWGRCQLCWDLKGRSHPIEVCFHVFGRARYVTRWDLDNALGTCSGANKQYDEDDQFILDVRDWYRKTYGQEQWDGLVRRNRTVRQVPTGEIEDIRAELKKFLEGNL